MGNFYVYVYLDPRKPGTFVFEELQFDYEPIYVGKGKKDRLKKHIYLCKNSKTHFHNKLELIIREGFIPNYKILVDNLSESDALKEEVRVIKLIGRQDNGGTLTNLTDGGEGQTGLKHKEESKKKTSSTLKNNLEFQEYMRTDEYREKISKSLMGHNGYGKGIPRSEEVKNKIRESLRGRPGRKHTDTSKSKMSMNNTGKGNPNSKIYKIEIDGELFIFETRKELYSFVEEFNKRNNLRGPNRVSVEGIINRGISKNFKLISIDHKQN